MDESKRPDSIDTVKQQLQRIAAQQQNLLLVSKQGDGHYTTIREAITHAFPNTRILVRPGTYLPKFGPN